MQSTEVTSQTAYVKNNAEGKLPQISHVMQTWCKSKVVSRRGAAALVMLSELEMSSSPLGEVATKSGVTGPILIWESASFAWKDLLLICCILDYLPYFLSTRSTCGCPLLLQPPNKVRISIL